MDVSYNYLTAYENGVHEHAQAQMKKLGFKYKRSEPVSVCDSWVFELEEPINKSIDDFPPYIKVLKEKWKWEVEE